MKRRNALKRRPLEPPSTNPPWIHKKPIYRGFQRPAHPP